MIESETSSSISFQANCQEMELEKKPSMKYPIDKSLFLEFNKEYLFNFEIDEINKMDEQSIYFSGQCLQRSQAELQLLKNKESEDQIIKDFDDEEGYYNVLLGDHLVYRFELLKILGKGSFAQVVACFDHKLQKKVAVKITRNTDLDHKFAQSESKLLNYLMDKDKKDEHHVVRMVDEFYFRDHHCFVFELLHKDLFEHLKENDFIGFPTSKIKQIAV